MTIHLVLLAALAASGHDAIDRGLVALDAGRYEDAARDLESSPDLAASYDGLVGLAVARGRLGRLDAAEEPLLAALRLDPRRPEARIERAGLRFLRARHQEAADDLRVALRAREDAYARDLLASSLLLLGRPVDAISEWNRLGRPRLARLTLQGLAHTRDRIVRDELRFREGELLGAGALRASLRTLEDMGLFASVNVRASVVDKRDVHLELVLEERYGLGDLVDAATATALQAALGQARLRYSNLGGLGVNLAGSYRWEGVRPRLAATVESPRPFGLPVQSRIAAYREEQPYDLGGPTLYKARGFDLSLRRVFGRRTWGRAGLRFRHRSFSEPSALDPESTRPGRLVGLEVEAVYWPIDGRRHRLEASLLGFGSGTVLGAVITYQQAQVSLRHRTVLVEGGEGRPARLALVGRGLWGRGGDGMPVDQMYAAGTAWDAAYPLRAHRLRDHGVLGVGPIGRELLLGNVECRWEVWGISAFGLGLAVFQDVAQVRHGASVQAAGARSDAGIGLRMRMGRSASLRVDYGHGLTDGASAWTVALGEAF